MIVTSYICDFCKKPFDHEPVHPMDLGISLFSECCSKQCAYDLDKHVSKERFEAIRKRQENSVTVMKTTEKGEGMIEPSKENQEKPRISLVLNVRACNKEAVPYVAELGQIECDDWDNAIRQLFKEYGIPEDIFSTMDMDSNDWEFD